MWREILMKLYVFIGMWDGLPDKVEVYASVEEAGKEYYEWTGEAYEDQFIPGMISECHWEGSDIYEMDLDYFSKKNDCVLLTNEEVEAIKECLEDYNMIIIDMKDYIEGRNILKSVLKKLGLITEGDG